MTINGLTLTMENPDTSTGWHSQQLYEIDPVTGQ